MSSTALLQEFNETAAKLRNDLDKLQETINTLHHNETMADYRTNPTVTPLNSFKSAGLTFITLQELEDWKRAALAELGLDYIPHVLAEFKGGE
jgi:hypothetical protein